MKTDVFQAIDAARTADPSLRTIAPHIKPELDDMDIPHERDPIFKIGFFTNDRGNRDLYIIHTISLPLLATGENSCILPRIGTLKRLEFWSPPHVTRASIVINRTSKPLDIDAMFLPRRQGMFVVIEHGSIDLPSLAQTELIISLHPNSALVPGETFRVTYWQARLDYTRRI